MYSELLSFTIIVVTINFTQYAFVVNGFQSSQIVFVGHTQWMRLRVLTQRTAILVFYNAEFNAIWLWHSANINYKKSDALKFK